MKFLRSNLPIIFVLVAVIALQACKTKKPVVVPPPDTVAKPVDTVAKPVDTVVKKPVDTVPAPPAPDYNFSNIQFEFNSSVLKTESYPILDKAATEMKKDTTVSFTLDGYASSEGTKAHNLKLSNDRANSVKTYLVNGGIKSTSLSAKGYGESNPIGDNNTEAGKVANRRVEIKKQ